MITDELIEMYAMESASALDLADDYETATEGLGTTIINKIKEIITKIKRVIQMQIIKFATKNVSVPVQVKFVFDIVGDVCSIVGSTITKLATINADNKPEENKEIFTKIIESANGAIMKHAEKLQQVEDYVIKLANSFSDIGNQYIDEHNIPEGYNDIGLYIAAMTPVIAHAVKTLAISQAMTIKEVVKSGKIKMVPFKDIIPSLKKSVSLFDKMYFTFLKVANSKKSNPAVAVIAKALAKVTSGFDHLLTKAVTIGAKAYKSNFIGNSRALFDTAKSGIASYTESTTESFTDLDVDFFFAL